LNVFKLVIRDILENLIKETDELISVVIPMYNEELNVILLHGQINSALIEIGLKYEIIYVDDGSKDSTFSLLKKIAQSDSTTTVINLKRNYGQTAAMMAGIDYADGDIIVVMDGDLQNDPKDIVKLIDQLHYGFDVASGWRINRKDNRLKRNIPSAIANRLISWISGIKLHDYGCSLKAYRKDVIKGVKLYGEMHRFIPIYASWQGAKVVEVPVSHNARKFGKSNYGLERVVKVLLDLMVVKFLASYSTKPIYVFGTFGILCCLFSVITFCLALYIKFFENRSLIMTPLPTLSAMLFITGIMSILMGLLAEIIMRTYYESQDKRVYSICEIVKMDR
jgi:glycosyltransferase involved in cell wall biosynthesis